MTKNYRKKVFTPIRLDAELYDMIRELMPLYEGDRTKTIEQCLFAFMDSEAHFAMLDKLHRLRQYLLDYEERYNSIKNVPA